MELHFEGVLLKDLYNPMRKIENETSLSNSIRKIDDCSRKPIKLTEQEELELQRIEEEVAMDIFKLQMDSYDDRHRKRRKKSSPKADFWQTLWGQTLTHPNVNNPKSREGKQFRRRFRLPYPLFRYLVTLCKDLNIFDSVYCSSIPVEAKVLGCLRILGRDACADGVNEITGNAIGESTMNYIFKKFIHGLTEKLFPILLDAYFLFSILLVLGNFIF